MPSGLGAILRDPEKRTILSWLGGGAVIVAGGIWTVVTFVVEHKEAHKEPTAQMQEALTGQLIAKDAQINELMKQIAALTKSLLEKNPAAGPGAQQIVGAAVGSIAQGAAEGDARLQQAFDLLKANKIADATRLLNAVAEEKTARAEQTARAGQETAPAEKDRTDAAIARRNLGAIAGLVRGHALLIGVSDYKSGWPQLPNVKNDLHDLKAGLEPYFETVDIVANPTVAQLRDRMSEFLLGQWNKPDARLFIYYSGHGFTDFNQSSRQNDGYITGTDTPGKAVAKAMPFYEIESWNRQTRARHVLMVFDSCFTGSLFQTIMTEPGQNDFDSVRRVLRNPVRYTKAAAKPEPSQNDLDAVRRLLGKPMRYYITACRQNEEVSADGTFAHLLLRGLRGEADVYHQGIISAEELGSYLYHEVPKYSPRPQTPQFKSIGNARLSEGQFFFLTEPAAP